MKGGKPELSGLFSGPLKGLHEGPQDGLQRHEHLRPVSASLGGLAAEIAPLLALWQRGVVEVRKIGVHSSDADDKDSDGAVKPDGLRTYKKVAAQSEGKILRLASLQHCKRPFVDMKGNPDADGMLKLANSLYEKEHEPQVGRDVWTVEDNLRGAIRKVNIQSKN